ncbi:hypothetical protein H7J77_17175 [Mycolicibacillus parakoreensis]|uniref:Uncharacterized protein n=1 Tax=Mycolicibacillus parakoreensis TaxID=1069221 RepID=A0ABY3U272_9MYCO|nr:hypothetical protein [Mycolicibacillus parakoreensis]MCV7317269.1 hypothetical protein [Mycolicibacillus parakoreensis]ULN51519.1 hypothetical protein MIU77_11435 [Mycolicibacillus parakoreensis]
MNRHQYAYRCNVCNRRLGLNRMHLVVNNTTILCARCANENGRRLHSELHPDCPEDWHDVYDHPLKFATRAGVFRVQQIRPDIVQGVDQ